MTIKTQSEIKIIAQGGKLLANILSALLKKAKAGVYTKDLDIMAQNLINKTGGTASFTTVNGYKWATCMCVNDEVVHGIPDDLLKEGDILCIDIGLLYKGFHTDTAWTIPIKNPKSLPGRQTGKIQNPKEKKIDKFLFAGRVALNKAIKEARAGNRVGHISKAIQETIENNGYSVVRSLVGHGIGRNLHEDPQIPGFVDRPLLDTPKLVEGMTLAIEVIYNEGKPEVVYKNNDGWTIVTKDGSLSAVFEHTILVRKEMPLILTKSDV